MSPSAGPLDPLATPAALPTVLPRARLPGAIESVPGAITAALPVVFTVLCAFATSIPLKKADVTATVLTIAESPAIMCPPVTQSKFFAGPDERWFKTLS